MTIVAPGTNWHNLSAAARQMAQGDPFRASVLYNNAIAECRRTYGPNAEQLAVLFDELSHVYKSLDRVDDAKSNSRKAAQIRCFNNAYNFGKASSVALF